MSDDLNDLKNLMDAATPRPDVVRRAENLALAQKSFENLQGSRDAARPTSNRPLQGLWTGVTNMLNSLTSRAGLTACTALVAVGLVGFTPIGEGLLSKRQIADQNVLPAPIAVKKEEKSDITFDGYGRFGLQHREESGRVSADLAAVEQRFRFHADQEARPELSLGQQSKNSVAPPISLGAPAPVSQTKRAVSTDQMHIGEIASEPVPTIASTETEAFANNDTNPLNITTETPVSTFSIDVDTASYSVIRNSLTNAQMPPKDAVRVEEMINYFTYDYPTPDAGAAFRPTVSITQTPWNTGTQLVQIGIQGTVPDTNERPPLNLVFLIDTSGSMNSADKLPLLKQSFRLMLSQLRPTDHVAIVTYAGSAGQVLAPTPASERSTILAALNNLSAGGSTAGQAGLQQAYATADAMAEDGDINRVILATDGDFNVGLSNPDALKDYIADKRESGTYLSVLGFGRGNLDDATMQALAQNGNGQAAYIDTLSEAQKVLVDQLGGALFPIANDVKSQVEFNPAQIAEYRLIGYETRALRREDFNNDKVDAGDIGAGHQVTALYEVTPVGSPAQLSDPLRYGTVASTDGTDELGFLRLRYKAPGSDNSQLIEAPINAAEGASNAGFAAAIAGFGQLLRNNTYLGDWTYQDAITLANETKGDDPFGYRSEAIQLMRLAASLSQN
ncbi:MAG: VWA domain-containing protein [Sulfitobacter sp.]